MELLTKQIMRKIPSDIKIIYIKGETDADPFIFEKINNEWKDENHNLIFDYEGVSNFVNDYDNSPELLFGNGNGTSWDLSEVESAVRSGWQSMLGRKSPQKECWGAKKVSNKYNYLKNAYKRMI